MNQHRYNLRFLPHFRQSTLIWKKKTKRLAFVITGGYIKVFGEPVSNLGDNEFRVLAGAYFVCDHIRETWEAARAQRREQKTPLHPSLERRWMVYFAVGELLRLAYVKSPADLDNDLRRLSKPNWLDDSENSTKACLNELFGIATAALTQVYTSRSQSESFRHRNWFRVEQTLSDIRKGLEPIPVFRGTNNPLPKLR